MVYGSLIASQIKNKIQNIKMTDMGRRSPKSTVLCIRAFSTIIVCEHHFFDLAKQFCEI